MSTFAQLDALLERNAGARTEADLAAAIAEADRPTRVQIAGRAGSGRSAVARALRLPDATFVDVDSPASVDVALDGDVVVYVLAERLHPADREALAIARPASTIVVLNKADAVDPDWAVVTHRVNDVMKVTGIQTVPLIGVVAATTVDDGIGEDELHRLRRLAQVDDPALTLTPDLFVAADAPINTQDRLQLLSRWELVGVATALDAIRRDPQLGPAELTRILHAVSGIDALEIVVAGRIRRSVALRGGALLDTLERCAARDGLRDDIEKFLRSDTATQLGLAAGLASPALMDVITDDDVAEPTSVRQAQQLCVRWSGFADGGVATPGRRAAQRVRRGYAAAWRAL